ncbi:hypothetical protein GSI_03779 [Ganoderma sinense ZZ0214-1]|uniref:Uncharacterized protein n=1 Tax=Ganoderma sinense ZZ0214-1 TaxID=1077348 RepID=A0A2G8SKH6_9APHY|nr:hypothetical protein GSI_03779 [Ganoderma sinense ZZ0214-1]
MRLEEILRCLPNSAVPVTELSLYLERIDVVALREILPFIRHLEQFIIITRYRPRRLRRAHLLGKTVFAHMPRLHTFLLCTTRRARNQPTPLHNGYGSYFYEQQEACLRAFDRHAPWLQRVMLTTGLEWVKQANGTWDDVEGQGF